MPELPEVETLVRGLQPAVDHRIRSVEVLDPRLQVDPSPLVEEMISAIVRRGKYIVIRLAEQGDLVVHLRMSGHLGFDRTLAEIPYTRMIIHLEGEDSIYFVNPRRLGTVTHWPDGFDARLGLEPLSAAFTVEELSRLAKGSRAPIKSLLLNQSKIAGVGNIYAAETLWQAGIDPRRIAKELTSSEITKVHTKLRSVLREAVSQLGTRLGESVSDYRPDGSENARYQNKLSVYGREGLPCQRCGEPIARIVQAGRSTCYCPSCQTGESPKEGGTT